MKYPFLISVLALCCVSLAAQAPPHPFVSELGFSYTLPAGWQPMHTQATLSATTPGMPQPVSKKRTEQSSACARTVFSARHGNPASVISIAALPFSCFGQVIKPVNLPGFAAGVSEGLKRHFEISDPVYGGYTLGSHKFWIERAVGVPKSHNGARYTIEIACSILKKSAICWMTAAASAGGLRAFENGLVSLDGEPAIALVPESAFTAKSP